jgi:16S rRNA (cytosine967-C5)-methyltransferase
MRVEQQDSFVSELLHSTHTAELSTADHGLTTELVMGVLRWRAALDASIARVSSRPLSQLDTEALVALRLGAYQLQYLERIPTHAAIHESVELVKRSRKRSAASFVNAILRKLVLATKPTPTEPVRCAADLALCYSHPEWLVERWVEAYGREITERICGYDQQIPRTSIRLRNPSAEQELLQQGIQVAPGKLLSWARRVLSGEVTRTAAFRQRRLSIQDEASQLVALLVGPGRILDCCAAPGGKTAILADRHPQSQVIALELHPHRARLLRKRVDAENVQVVAADARRLPFSCQFDSVLVDAPCSGTGTLARNPEIKWRLRPEDLHDLQSRQLDILRSAARQTAPGGRLVYSTCSLEREENWGVIEQFLAKDSSFRVLDSRQELERLAAQGELAWNSLDSLVRGPYLLTIPGVHPCDGFFAAILQKY